MKRLGLASLQVFLFSLGILVCLVSIIALQLAIALHQQPEPQAILVLEGSTERIYFAATFSTLHSTLPIWVSGNPGGLRLNQKIFHQAGVAAQQVHYDVCATDTVTNFTCNVTAFTSRKIQHIYVITSDYHMPRARAIATIVYGSHGIAITPITVSSHGEPPESGLRIIRDCLRSIIWLITGRTGASLRNKI